PISVSYSVLYSHRELLKKYNKKPPKTWHELIETSNFILEEEKKINNTQLRAYNGLFNDNWNAKSFYEFIYSCRDTKNSPFPDIKSNSMKRSYEMIKKLMKDISSDEEFKSNDDYTITELLLGTSIFLKFWILAEPYNSRVMSNYDISILPGYFKGVSTSSYSGFNMGININIKDKEKINAAVELIKYSVSKDIQKKLFMDGDSVTAMNYLLDDDEVCKVKDCEMLKSIQLIKNKKIDMNLFPDYDEKFYSISKKYLYENVSLEDTINHLDDISRIYYITLDTSESYIGLIIFLFRENFSPFFKFLPSDLWILVIMGIVITLCVPVTDIGQITITKCQIQILLLSMGVINYHYVLDTNESSDDIDELSFTKTNEIGNISKLNV
ncbi:hypothetical protein BCR36DRAFT_289100, partial [Piromyces finnis]